MEPSAEPSSTSTPPLLPRPPEPDETNEVAESGPYPPGFEPTQRTPRAGQLTPQWTNLFWIGWLLAAASLFAVWYSSRLVGLSTWWLGPEAEPRLFLVHMVPFVAPGLLVVGAVRRFRGLPWWGIGGAVYIAVIAAFDIDRVPGFAAVEFLVAAGCLLLSVAAFGGMYRRADPDVQTIAQTD